MDNQPPFANGPSPNPTPNPGPPAPQQYNPPTVIQPTAGPTPPQGPAGPNMPAGGQPAPLFAPDPVPGAPFGTPPAGAKKRRKMPAILGVALLLFIILGGGVAAAYYKIVIPNRPENVLKTAVSNTLQQKNVTADIVVEGKEKDSPAYKVQSLVKAKLEQPLATSATLKVTVSGVTISAEARLVDGTLYVKVGDLSNITNLLGAAAPTYEPLIKGLNSKLTEQWIEFDSTILKTAGADCFTDISLTLSDADFQLLDKLYQDSAFATINSSTGDTIKGQATTKFELTLDPKKATKFSDGLKDLSVVKKANECAKKADSTSKGDLDITNSVKSVTDDAEPAKLTVWVDKKTKLIVQVASEASAKEKKDGISGKGTVGLSYAPVSVAKPENPKPFLTVVSEIAVMAKSDPVLGPTLDQYISGLQ